MNKILVFQSDFGVIEGTVAQMYGVALSIDPNLKLLDITHNVPKFDTWSASHDLYQTMRFWPEGTVFVSVVDPGVGSNRQSVVAKTANVVCQTADEAWGLYYHCCLCLNIFDFNWIDDLY